MNKKYTPTTEDVCKRYVNSRHEMWGTSGPAAFRREFKRWLTEHDAKVAAKAIEKYEKGLEALEKTMREMEDY